MAIDKNSIAKEAQKFAAKGQFDKAIAEWKRLVKESPNDANIYNTIGDLCLKKDSKPEAVDAYQTAADILASDGFTSKAIALYKKVLNIDPKKIEAHLALGDMNAEKGLTGNALESYKIVADHYTQQNDTVKALGIYQKMADLNPSNVAFKVKVADMYAKQGMKPEATKAYLEAADVHMSKDAFKDARQLFEKVLALDANNKEVYHKAGIVYFKEGKFVEACKALKPAFESDPANKELVDVYLEALSKAGREAEAEETLKAILEKDPGNNELREKLYLLYLARKDHEKALAEASILANNKAEAGEKEAAEEILKTFVTESPGFSPGRWKLAEFYVSLNRSDDAAKELLQAADLLIEEGDRTGAKAVLGRILELVPHLPEAQERLERLDTPSVPPPPKPKVVITPEPAAAPQPVAPQPVAPQPTPATVVGEEDPAITEAFTEADVLIKYGLIAKATEQLETLTSKFSESPGLRVKLRDLYHEQRNTDKAVRHALLAVALYTKLGRKDDAETVLQSTRQMAPDHPAILSRLARTSAASAAAPPATAAAPVAPDQTAFEPLSAGEPFIEEIAPELPELSPTLPPVETPAPDMAQAASVEEQLTQEPEPTGVIEFDGLDSGMPPIIEEAAPTAPAAPYKEEAAKPSPFPETPVYPEKPAPVVPEEVIQAAPQARPAEVDIREIWAEAEFYFQQGLFDEARKHYAKIIEITPSDKRAINRLSEISREEDETQEFSKLAEAVDDLENALTPGAQPSGDMPMTSSDEDAVRSLMQEIHQLKQAEKSVEAPEEELFSSRPQKTDSPPPRTAPPPRQPEPPNFASRPAKMPFEPVAPAMRAEEDFFDLGAELQAENRANAPEQGKQSDDFFDLAAELRDELSSVAVPVRSAAVPAEEQSLDDIFEEFKKGVEQQAVKEDADTHYNLGVAYREMGLLDDAIAEFIMTPEDEPKFIQSRYMLGLCYMEKGEYRNAIGEIQNALDYSESLGENNPNYVGMHYDLGLAYQGAANNDHALREFRMVFDADPYYRDVAAKVKELQQGDFISLDQIKDDIEKEISSKFFAEGERIEREEKTRKTEKIKNW